jgi:hypothetical protein
MNKAFMLLLCFVSGSAIGQSNPDPATGLWYGKWALSFVPIALGLVFHLLTLWIAAVVARECIKHGRFERTSAFPFVGPLLICFGLWWSPSEIPVWVYLIPWGLEFLAGIVSVLVQKATHARSA